MNPRYGITVYRISSPAHSTSLPSFRSSCDEKMNSTERPLFCQTPLCVFRFPGENKTAGTLTHAGSSSGAAKVLRRLIIPKLVRESAFFRRTKDFHTAHIGTKRFRNRHRTVGVLIIFENSDERTADGETGTVQRVN